jgi:hypothetical protein
VSGLPWVAGLLVFKTKGFTDIGSEEGIDDGSVFCGFDAAGTVNEASSGPNELGSFFKQYFL